MSIAVTGVSMLAVTRSCSAWDIALPIGSLLSATGSAAAVLALPGNRATGRAAAAVGAFLIVGAAAVMAIALTGVANCAS